MNSGLHADPASPNVCTLAGSIPFAEMGSAHRLSDQFINLTSCLELADQRALWRKGYAYCITRTAQAATSRCSETPGPRAARGVARATSRSAGAHSATSPEV